MLTVYFPMPEHMLRVDLHQAENTKFASRGSIASIAVADECVAVRARAIFVDRARTIAAD